MGGGLKFGKQTQIGKTVYDKDHENWIKKQNCSVCGTSPDCTIIDPHHIWRRDKGSKRMRSDYCVPLCRKCHSWVHGSGQKTVEEFIGRSFKDMAENYWKWSKAERRR